MAFADEEKQILDRLTESADDVDVKLSVDVGDGSPTDIDGIVQMEFWFDFYEEIELEEGHVWKLEIYKTWHRIYCSKLEDE